MVASSAEEGYLGPDARASARVSERGKGSQSRRPPIRRIPRHKLDMYNEFKAPLTTAPECGLIPLVTNRALHDIGIKPENILITHGDPEAPIPENKNLLIIDMTPLDDLWINTMMKMNKFGW